MRSLMNPTWTINFSIISYGICSGLLANIVESFYSYSVVFTKLLIVEVETF